MPEFGRPSFALRVQCRKENSFRLLFKHYSRREFASGNSGSEIFFGISHREVRRGGPRIHDRDIAQREGSRLIERRETSVGRENVLAGSGEAAAIKPRIELKRHLARPPSGLGASRLAPSPTIIPRDSPGIPREITRLSLVGPE